MAKQNFQQPLLQSSVSLFSRNHSYWLSVYYWCSIINNVFAAWYLCGTCDLKSKSFVMFINIFTVNFKQFNANKNA